MEHTEEVWAKAAVLPRRSQAQFGKVAWVSALLERPDYLSSAQHEFV
jgi:hypothetical protein